MRRAIFLDRDGVLIKIKKVNNKPYSVDEITKIKILKETQKTLKKLKEKFLLIMVTNQPNVSRGFVSKAMVNKINLYIKNQLDLDDIYCCFHDDHHKCKCRKPKAGMLIDAKKKWKIDLKKSFMVGDRKKDMLAGAKVNCHNLFIDYNYDEVKPRKNLCFYIKSIKDVIKHAHE